MAWIESHQSLSRHRKTLAATTALRVDRHKLIGHMHELWWWGLDNADINGLVGHLAPETIAEAAGWPVKQAKAFVEVLVDVGFLDHGDDGYVIHDWYDFAGKLMEKREANKERMQRARAGHGPEHVPPTNGTRAAHVQHTNGARAGATVPNRTVPNSVSNETVSEPAEMSPGDDRVDELYRHYKARIQPRSRLCPRKKIAARLKRFSVDELKAGIEHFADSPWWMEHNSDKGAEWFFESDGRSEQFLLLQPRAAQNVVSMDRQRAAAIRLPVDRTGAAN